MIIQKAPKLTKGQLKSIHNFADKNKDLHSCPVAEEFTRMHKGVKVTWILMSNGHTSWYRGYIGLYWVAGAHYRFNHSV